MQESFYDSIAQVAKSAKIPFFDWMDFRERYEYHIKKQKVDTIITISWKYFLPLKINKLVGNRSIIIHDSLLPKYSGFAPLATAIIKGEKKVGITVLFASEKLDNGDIISQKTLAVRDDEYMSEITDRITVLYVEAVREIIQELKKGKKIKATPQDHSQRTYSIWRNPEDCQINWHDSAKNIYNFIRAVGYPYVGAYSFLGDNKVRIWKSELIEPDVKFEIRQPGKIWELDSQGRPVVVCGEGMLKISEATIEGKSMLPVKILRQQFYSLSQNI